MAKLTNKQKIEIYERKLKGESTKKLSIEFDINISNVKYLFSLINKHGKNILRNDKNRYYSKEFKEIVINRVLIGKESINSVALAIPDILSNIFKGYLALSSVITLTLCSLLILLPELEHSTFLNIHFQLLNTKFLFLNL